MPKSITRRYLARHPQVCPYCAVRPATEVEHVVARAFFDEAQKRFIKVPACPECNRGRGDGGSHDISLDEEYMRNVICMGGPGSAHPVAMNLLKNAVARSLENSPKLTDSFLRATRSGPARIRGIWVPNATRLTVELDRFARVLRKITRGLYHYVNEKPLPHDHLILVDPNLKTDGFHRCVAFIQSGRWCGEVLGDDVFGFLVRKYDDAATATVWVMTFYGRYCASTITLPPRVRPSDLNW